MQYLSRDDQERIIVQFERDYGLIVMEYNRTKSPEILNKASVLAKEIKLSTKPNYFEDDLLFYLREFSFCIEKYIDSSRARGKENSVTLPNYALVA